MLIYACLSHSSIKWIPITTLSSPNAITLWGCTPDYVTKSVQFLYFVHTLTQKPLTPLKRRGSSFKVSTSHIIETAECLSVSTTSQPFSLFYYLWYLCFRTHFTIFGLFLSAGSSWLRPYLQIPSPPWPGSRSKSHCRPSRAALISSRIRLFPRCLRFRNTKLACWICLFSIRAVLLA